MTKHDNILIIPVRTDDEVESIQLYRVNNESIMLSVEYKKYKLTSKTSWLIDRYAGDLSEYKWPIVVGRAKELTEEQWKEVVPELNAVAGRWPNYCGGRHPFFSTATGSGMSLLHSHGIDPETNPLILKKEGV